MKMIPVSSSDIVAVGYEGTTLYIEFNRGATYSYSAVPQSVYNGLMNAYSHGTYFHQYIKNAYRGTRIR